MAAALLIRRAELLDGSIADLRIRAGLVAETGVLAPGADEQVVEAGGGLLIPGLHDHHAHIAATAAALQSVRCGPPEVADAAALAAVLARPGTGWLRGVGYHESVTGGLIDRRWLDGVVPGRPVRMQHRSGRMWIFNSAGLEVLLGAGVPVPAALDRQTGQLFDDDGWVRRVLGGVAPSFASVGADYARYGVTGVTDMNPGNDDAAAAHFAREHASGALPQRVVLAGTLDLRRVGPEQRLGPVKIHLHEAQLPDFDEVMETIRLAHGAGRAVAVHCVTAAELVFTLAALREAGVLAGDRIEHASVTPDEQLQEIAALGLAVVVQPNFVAERGDAYLTDIAPEMWPQLYRLRGFRDAHVTMAGGSDTPFGAADPWAAMAAAVSRRTAGGATLGAAEALTPEAALALFLAEPLDLGVTRRVAVGGAADLCLLHQPWREARRKISARLVRATFIGGRLVYDGVDQAPA